MLDSALQIIRDLFARVRAILTPQQVDRGDEGLDMVLNGQSIASTAAMLWPHEHGPIIVTRQRELEGRIRAYVQQLEGRIGDLEEQGARITKAFGQATVRAQQAD